MEYCRVWQHRGRFSRGVAIDSSTASSGLSSHAHHSLDLLHEPAQDAAVRELLHLPVDSCIVFRIARRPHDVLAQWEALGQGVVKQQIRGVAFLLGGCCVFRRMLDAVLEQALECSIFCM